MYVFSVVTADVLPVISFHLHNNYIWIQIRGEQTNINVLDFLYDFFVQCMYIGRCAFMHVGKYESM